MKLSLRCPELREGIALVILSCFASISLHARPSPHAKNAAQPQAFLRQVNTKSNVEFSYTNRGVLFHSGIGQNEGLFWPRGSGNSYIFGEGMWFACQKDTSPTAREKLCDVGYNQNSGAGWYLEGERSQVGLSTGTDGAMPDSKYISYVRPRYDATSGKFIQGSSPVVPAPYYAWPLWDTSATKTLGHNYYFGDYISDVSLRDPTKIVKNSHAALPAMVSEEDIVNLYTDEDVSNNPEYQPNKGYPFGIDIQEVIYSWSFGRYRDMIFVRYKVKNSSTDTLFNSWMAPAFDPDLDNAVDEPSDANSYVNDSLVHAMADTASISQLREPYRSDPTKLNMAVQWRNVNQPPNGKQYGWLGVSLVESPVIDKANGNIIPNDDSATLHGYGPNSLFQNNQLGLATVRAWTINNDPTDNKYTPNARYDFVSTGTHDVFNGVYTDQRLLIATGPFTLIPGQSAEATLVLTFAHVSDSDYKKNFGSLLLLTDFAHQVFGEIDSASSSGTTNYFVNNFQVAQQSSVKNEIVSNGLTIEQPYPNPFRTDCSIQYRNDYDAPVSYVVSDVLGRQVQAISLGEIPAGERTLVIDGNDLAPGMYHVIITAGERSRSTNIIHTR
jgi:hypothetical protein